MIRHVSKCAIVLALGLAALEGRAASPRPNHALSPGLYKIDVLTGNASGAQLSEVKQVNRCISSASIVNHTVFAMLSNFSVSQCPEYQVCGGEFRTGFVAQCAGRDAQSALGMFALEPTNFRGRIDVRDASGTVIGTEIQYGDRVGDCPGPGAKK
jgi:hypothetical protein